MGSFKCTTRTPASAWYGVARPEMVTEPWVV